MAEPTEGEILWERALQPPMSLIDYRMVQEGREPANENQRQLLAVFRENPAQFRREWREEEKAYRMGLAAMGKAGPAKAKEEEKPRPSVRDEGAERAGELLDRLLEEAGESS